MVAQHVNAITHYRDTGDASRLAGFRGTVVGGVELETDPREVQRLSGQGQLDFEEFYEQP